MFNPRLVCPALNDITKLNNYAANPAAHNQAPINSGGCMLETLAQSATFGFGSSFGRDLYRQAKNNPIVLIILGFFMAIYGTRLFYTGFDKDPVERFLVNRLIAFILTTIGLAIITTTTGVGFNIMFNIPWLSVVAGIVTGISAIFLGMEWGKNTRSEMIEAAEIEAHNLQFLHDKGFTDHEFEEELFQDADGNVLRLKEEDEDKMVFTLVGKRGKRAAIRLEEGRMTSYTGVMKI